MIAAPTFSQIKAQVAAILQRSPHSQVIGIHAKGRWTGDRMQKDGEQCYLIEQCDSPLSIRIALQKYQPEHLESDDLKEAIQVIITPLDDGDLAEDILIRLAKQRLFKIDPWQIVKSLFRATNIDPRLTQHHWIPATLMDWMPANRYSPVMGGFLDAEIVWPLLLQHGLHLNAHRPDLTTILQWSSNPDSVERYHQASQDFRLAACNWLSRSAGPTVEIILHTVGQNQEPDALSLGLTLEIFSHPETQNKLDKAIGKIEERFLSGQSPSMTVLENWSIAAQQALKLSPPAIQQSLIQRSDAILADIGALEFAYLSSFSEIGFNQRLTQLSNYLNTLIKKPNPSNLHQLTQSFHNLNKHQIVIDSPNSRRLQRIEMAMRLSQWLVTQTIKTSQPPQSLEEAIAHHMEIGSYLDWARHSLRMAEPLRELAVAFGKLYDCITSLREEQNLHFAQLLKNWTAIGSERPNIVPIERILETFVAPLSSEKPVLFLVLDGMSVAVGHELISDLVSRNWQLIAPKDLCAPVQPGLAAIPSITSVSRTSLLMGKLQQGQKNNERVGFSTNPELLKQCKQSTSPLLFHKDSIQASETPIISDEISEAILSTKNQIVGVVINAVDDLLSKGEQVDTIWTAERIKVLLPLLEAANTTKRLIILTSDHGHVLENKTKYHSASGGERWREADGTLTDFELQIEGPRVLNDSKKKIVVPWTEKIRYCRNKKNGYHGGITPQEMIVPIAVLAPPKLCPSGWEHKAQNKPDWWTIPKIQSEKIIQVLTGDSNQKLVNLGPLFEKT